MVSPLRAVRPTNRRPPAVDDRTRLHLPLQRLLPSLILRQVQGHATEAHRGLRGVHVRHEAAGGGSLRVRAR